MGDEVIWWAVFILKWTQSLMITWLEISNMYELWNTFCFWKDRWAYSWFEKIWKKTICKTFQPHFPNCLEFKEHFSIEYLVALLRLAILSAIWNTERNMLKKEGENYSFNILIG